MNGKDRNYHLSKTKLCDNKGIQLIHIFADEWVNKNDIVKNRLAYILNKNTTKIYARKTIIKEINSTISNNFLEKYHIQGKDNSGIRLGAYYNNELIAVMTFGKLRNALGNKIKNDNEYELIRYATSNISYIGGASKMLNYFIKKYNPNLIISYADKRWSKGKLYESIGFNKIHDSKPNYWYTNDYNHREHRFGYTKSKILSKMGGDPNLTEWENMVNFGYDRIWDCGSIKYELKIN